MRSGVIAQKVGMTRIFTDAGEHVPVTVLKVDSCQVVAHRTKEKNGYTALQVGVGKAKVKNVSKAERGRFAVAQVEPKRKIAEFRVSEDAVIPVGAEITADHFIAGQFVDVTGITTGKGFAGGMKRWNFGGLRATHGVSVSHRSIGSTGGRQDPGKTFKNKKMPGHLGVERVTTQNLRVVSTDVERGLILVEGAVPGVAGGWIFVRDAVKRKLPKEVPMPGAFRMPATTLRRPPRLSRPKRRMRDETRYHHARRRNGRFGRAERERSSVSSRAPICSPVASAGSSRSARPARTRSRTVRRSTGRRRRSTSRRAPAAPVTAPRALPSSAAAAAPSVRRCAAMLTTCPRRSVLSL